jgi:hypothetical protein
MYLCTCARVSHVMERVLHARAGSHVPVYLRAGCPTSWSASVMPDPPAPTPMLPDHLKSRRRLRWYDDKTRVMQAGGVVLFLL